MSQPQRFSQPTTWIPQRLRQKRLRAEYLLRRSILYVLLTILVVAGYVLLVGGLSLIFGGVIGANNPWLIGLMILVLALTLLPLRNRLQKGIDALLLRGQRTYQQHIQDFSRELAGAIELTSILRTLRQHILKALAPEQLHIYLFDPLNDRYLATLGEDNRPTSDIYFAPNNPLVAAPSRARKLPPSGRCWEQTCPSPEATPWGRSFPAAKARLSS